MSLLEGLCLGDVVWVIFPNSDGKTYKRRPAVVIYNDNEMKQIQVAMISSSIRGETNDRISIDEDSEEYFKMGLRTRSMIYLGMVQTINYALVAAYSGRCPDSLIQDIKNRRRMMDDE